MTKAECVGHPSRRIANLRKLTFRILFPLVQLILFLSVYKLHLFRSTWDWWDSLNAPALLLLDVFIRLAPIYGMPPRIMGLLPRDFIMLVGALILWFFSGLALDHARSLKASAERTLTAKRILAISLLIACGLRLAFLALPLLLPSYAEQTHSKEELIEGMAILVWSAVLVLLPLRGLILGLRHRLSSARSGTNPI
jgi:hypothetical protein